MLGERGRSHSQGIIHLVLARCLLGDPVSPRNSTMRTARGNYLDDKNNNALTNLPYQVRAHSPHPRGFQSNGSAGSGVRAASTGPGNYSKQDFSATRHNVYSQDGNYHRFYFAARVARSASVDDIAVLVKARSTAVPVPRCPSLH